MDEAAAVVEAAGFWASFGTLVLLAVVLGCVNTVIDSVLGTVGLKAMISKLPIIGSNWGLLVSIGMMATLDPDGKMMGYWGLTMTDKWMIYVVGGAVVYGMIPVKDAVVSMIGKGFRA